jgi:chemotaxis protein methyltransferase CheR
MLIEERSGLCFDESRRAFFAARVSEHLHASPYSRGSELLRGIQRSNVEYERLLDRFLTQETSFFRYPGVYDALTKRVLPELHAKRFWRTPRTLRAWSAGCATGEEAYSLAIAIAAGLPFADTWNIDILATDISRQALSHADRGVYSRRSLEAFTEKQLVEYWTPLTDGYQIKPRIRQMIKFTQLNLAAGAYVGRMDLIFCMNVLIYFSEPLRKVLVQRFYDALEPGGYLFLGHSESIATVRVRFQAIVLEDCILYRKPAAKETCTPELVTEGRA